MNAIGKSHDSHGLYWLHPTIPQNLISWFETLVLQVLSKGSGSLHDWLSSSLLCFDRQDHLQQVKKRSGTSSPIHNLGHILSHLFFNIRVEHPHDWFHLPMCSARHDVPVTQMLEGWGLYCSLGTYLLMLGYSRWQGSPSLLWKNIAIVRNGTTCHWTFPKHYLHETLWQTCWT